MTFPTKVKKEKGELVHLTGLAREARLGQRRCRGCIVDPEEPTQPEVGLHGGASLSHGMVNHHDFPSSGWWGPAWTNTLGVADLLLDRSGMALDHRRTASKMPTHPSSPTY